MTISKDIWIGAMLGAVLGAFLGSIVIPLMQFGIARFLSWRASRRPVNLLLGRMVQRDEPCKIFLRGFLIDQNTPLLEVVPRVGIGHVRNIHELWADVEGRAIANVLNVLGRAGKSHNVNIVPERDDAGEWNAHIFVIGAQYQKANDFFRLMHNVAYRIDDNNIIDIDGRIVSIEEGYGYGIVIKASNPGLFADSCG